VNHSQFIVDPSSFDHSSWLHGVGHTYRVMALTYVIGNDLCREKERDLAYCAAYIHDLARLHDGVCREHGPRSAEMKLPLFREFFLSHGLAEDDIAAIKTAIYQHSLLEELDKEHPHYMVTAILKDADALDRIRLGPFDLNPEYLRFPESKALIKPAQRLFVRTVRATVQSPDFYLDILRKILERRQREK
jgi:hypothetical protein